MAKLEAGSTAPAFTLPDQDGKPVKLSDFKGQQVIVYFYPADDTPGLYQGGLPVQRQPQDLREGRGRRPRDLTRRGREAHQVPHQVQAEVSPPHRRRQEGDGEVRRLGREDDVRQEDRRDHPLHLPRRPQRQDPTCLVARAGRRPCRQGARGDLGGVATPDRGGRAASATSGASGHHQVVRPPTVAACSSAPSLGQRPPARRSSMSSPMCEPPRRPSWRRVARSDLCRARSSSSLRGVRRPGSSPARHRISSASRFPIPATRS